MFDSDKCVGCYACLVACSIENGNEPGFNLREIYTYNTSIISGIPHYHLSLACNHCSAPSCVEQCPAAAITKDDQSGIVHIDEGICIGCRYCSWVCPFGAPVFGISEGVMKKCDMCRERIDDGYKPACESVCPTGALTTEISNPENAVQKVPFFPETDMYPAMAIAGPGRSLLTDQQYANTYPENVLHVFSENRKERSVEISLDGEWPLIFFTLLISVLGSVFAGHFFGKMKVDPLLFVISGLSGILLSIGHLGKKARSLRIVRNFLRSWLSRESLFFVLFLIVSIFSLSGVLNPVSGISGLLTVFLTAFSADMIYRRSATVRNYLCHSSQVSLTLLLFVSWMAGIIPLFYLMSLLKLILYIRRKVRYGFGNILMKGAAVLRLSPILVLPLSLILSTEPAGVWLFILLVAGEVIDRAEFYSELEILNPGKLMNDHFELEIRGMSRDHSSGAI